MKWADIIVTNNISNFGGWYTARICGKAKEFGKIFHYDTDDLLTQLYEGHRLEEVYKSGLSDTTKFIYNNSDIVTVTQTKFRERIKEFASNKTIIAVIKNAIDYQLPCWNVPKVHVPKNKFVRVGWAGGIHHEEDVKEFAGVPSLVNQKVGKENVRWDFYGKPPKGKPEDDWQQDVWKNYERIIMSGLKGAKNYTINSALNPDQYGMMFAYMDMAIAPLQMNEFNDSKSDIKVAEAGRYSIPLISSNVGCYYETIQDGKTGFLIPADAPQTEWVRVLTRVIKDKDLRVEMGKNLHKITEEHFDLNKVVHNRLTLYKAYFDHFGVKKDDPKI